MRWVMSKLSFDTCDVLIYDPVPSNRAATRAALYALGFRRTRVIYKAVAARQGGDPGFGI